MASDIEKDISIASINHHKSGCTLRLKVAVYAALFFIFFSGCLLHQNCQLLTSTIALNLTPTILNLKHLTFIKVHNAHFRTQFNPMLHSCVKQIFLDILKHLINVIFYSNFLYLHYSSCLFLYDCLKLDLATVFINACDQKPSSKKQRRTSSLDIIFYLENNSEKCFTVWSFFFCTSTVNTLGLVFVCLDESISWIVLMLRLMLLFPFFYSPCFSFP